MVNGERLPGSAVRDYFEKWASKKKRETGERTGRKYSDVCQQFLSSLGTKAEADLADLTRADVTSFRDALASRLAASSANVAVKIVRMAIKDAVIDGLIDTNVAIGVRPVKHRGAPNERRPFTLPELKRVLSKANDEWQGLILFGLYTGQRLGDIAFLTWQNLDLQQREISFASAKTGRRMLIPIAKPLMRFIEKMPAGDNPKQPLFPAASSVTRTGTLSNQFYDILVDAGLTKDRPHTAKKTGRSNKRNFNEIGFHALRHTATSLMKNAGISPAIVQDIIGHDSAAISQHYTHIESSAKRKALNTMPDVQR